MKHFIQTKSKHMIMQQEDSSLGTSNFFQYIIWLIQSSSYRHMAIFLAQKVIHTQHTKNGNTSIYCKKKRMKVGIEIYQNNKIKQQVVSISHRDG